MTLTALDYYERAVAGAAWLDENAPGWFELIEIERLTMMDPYQCVLGQLAGAIDRKYEYSSIVTGDVEDDGWGDPRAIVFEDGCVLPSIANLVGISGSEAVAFGFEIDLNEISEVTGENPYGAEGAALISEAYGALNRAWRMLILARTEEPS